ncbi:MAG: phosphoribosylamine--glycine ligase, partial [Bacteroidetes bacterium]|nr:phosphoribosylamine--glycine ligase [Bacteroidota bacterium]
KIIKPTIAGLRAEQLEYKGFVFFGLIKVDDAPYVIEYNCRMGDPETEVVMPRLQTDLVALFEQTCRGQLATVKVAQDPRFAVTVMAVSGGYPGDYQKGYPIAGLDQPTDAMVFHAGTLQQGDIVVTHGGRVLAVTSFGETPAQAAQASLQSLEKIQFQGIYYRRDIGYEFFR